MANTFSVTLTGTQEIPSNPSTANGTGTLTWNAAANTLTYDFTIRGLNFGQVTGMHFHSDAPVMVGAVPFAANAIAFGQLNPVQDTGGQLNPTQDTGDFKTIVTNPDGSWTVHGVWELTDPASIPITTFAPVLSSATPPPAGSSTVGSPVPLYWDIHTITFPSGEIRGQLVPTA